MSSNSRIVALAAGLAAALAGTTAALAAEVCPLRDGKPARYIDVFNGPPEEVVTLIPESTGKKRGYWSLGYVYEAGRTVTIRCKYPNGDPVDVNFPQKIDRCDFRIDKHNVLSLTCK